MKTKQLLAISTLLLSTLLVKAQHTFSIVAVDTITGEVGGAGATCYAVVNDIADVHPGVGFIHTQSYVDYDNQAYGKSLMDRGYLPQEIMDSLVAYDATSQPQLRQYAAVSLLGSQKSAAFTGTSCFTYRGQRVGANYAIAGNILIGAKVLDSMEVFFNRTTGTLADKLMAAMQGAKIIGADRRCFTDGVSSLSAYMIVAKPNDVNPNYYLNLNVENVYPGEPIDTLQYKYDEFLSTTGIKNIHKSNDIQLFPNPTNTGTITIKDKYEMSTIEFLNYAGETLLKREVYSKEITLDISNFERGIYLCKIQNKSGEVASKKLMINK